MSDTPQPPQPPPPRLRVVHRTDTPRPSSPYEQTHEGGGLTLRRRPAPRPVSNDDSNSRLPASEMINRP